MANKYDDADGVWRTIGGRRVFIRKGQSLSDAMKESGKFNTKKKQDDYEKKVYGSDVKKVDEQMKKTFGEDFKYAEELEDAKKEYIGDIPKKSYDIADEIEEKFGDKEVITRDEFEEFLTGKYDDEDADVRGILAQKGWETKFESDDEGDEGDLVRLKENKYDSVEDRYNNDKDFRDMLEKEHNKTLDAARKEIKAYLDNEDYFNKNGIESADDLYNQINDNYYNISRDDFDKIYNEESHKDEYANKTLGQLESIVIEKRLAESEHQIEYDEFAKARNAYEKKLDEKYESIVKKGRDAGLSDDTIFDASYNDNYDNMFQPSQREQLERFEKYIDDTIKNNQNSNNKPTFVNDKALNKNLMQEDISSISITTNSASDKYGYGFNEMLNTADREGLKVKSVSIGNLGQNKASIEFENGAKLDFYDLEEGKALINNADTDDFEKIQKALNTYRVRSKEDVSYDFNNGGWINNDENTKIQGMNNSKYEAKWENANKTPEQAKTELGWGHHNLTNQKAVEEKFGKSTDNYKEYLKKEDAWAKRNLNDDEYKNYVNSHEEKYGKGYLDSENTKKVKNTPEYEKLRDAYGYKYDKEPIETKDYKQIEKQLLDDYTKVDTDDLKMYRDTFKEQGKEKFASRLQNEIDKREQKSTNDTMNDAIRSKASKKTDYSKYNDKTTANFGKIDYYGNGRKSNDVSIEMELKDGVFKASGSIKNARGTDSISGGQNIDEIADMMKDNKDVQEIRDLWHKYHLNNMHAGTEKQEKALQKKFGGVNANKYDEQVDYLKSINLYEDNGHRFGSGWFKREIPDEDKERIIKLINKYNGKTDETMNDKIRRKANRKK